MAIKVELPACFGHSEEQLAFIREMGIGYLNLNVMPGDANEAALQTEAERLARYDLKISDLACPPLQKSAAIILGKPERDAEIEKFIELVDLAAKIGAPLVSVAWQPNGIFRTGRGPCACTRGGTAMYADLKEIEARPISNDRVYEREEIWQNFAYFLKAVLPACESAGVRLALHPNDPPVPSLGGVASLISSTADCKRALALANSPALAIKMCVGCWLENPAFGDLMQDIADFTVSGQLAEVHFRNVSAPLPYFEETLAEDGYADMHAILRQFVRCGFDGYMSVDHAFAGYESVGGGLASLAYPTGHLKGMLYAIQREIG